MLHNKVERTTAIVLLVICVAGASVMVTVSLKGHFTDPVILTQTRAANVSNLPFNSSVFLSSDVGSCSGPSGFTPCFGGNFSQAEVFNCTSAAASASGCTQLVINPSEPQNSYQITIWYPYFGHSNEPSWANCIYTDSGDPGQYYGAYCVSVNSTAFIVTEPAPPPL